MSREAAEAAWRVLESSGLKKLDGRSNIYLQGGGYTVTFYTELPTINPISKVSTNEVVVFSLIIAEKIYSSIRTEPQGGAVWGVGEDPPTEAGAVAAATRIVEFATKPR